MTSFPHRLDSRSFQGPISCWDISYRRFPLFYCDDVEDPLTLVRCSNLSCLHDQIKSHRAKGITSDLDFDNCDLIIAVLNEIGTGCFLLFEQPVSDA